jgi:hypothetical protein
MLCTRRKASVASRFAWQLQILKHDVVSVIPLRDNMPHSPVARLSAYDNMTITVCFAAIFLPIDCGRTALEHDAAILTPTAADRREAYSKAFATNAASGFFHLSQISDSSLLGNRMEVL